MDELRKIELSNLAVLYGVDNSGTGGAVQLGASRGLGDGEDGERVHLRLEGEVRMSTSFRMLWRMRYLLGVYPLLRTGTGMK